MGTYEHFEMNLGTGDLRPLPELDEFMVKQALLDTYFEEIEPHDFYRLLFPEGSFERLGHQEDNKGNGIAITITAGKPGADGKLGRNRGRKTIVTDGLEQLEDLFKDDFVVMSPVSYFGRARFASNALWLYSLTLDIDYVGERELRNLVNHFDSLDIIPTPTAIVNSGHGVHLYYMFEEPIPMYRQTQTSLKKLKEALVRRIWNRYTSQQPERIETLGVVQGFRMVGSTTKMGAYRLKAYRTGEKVTLEYLNSYVNEEDRAQIKLNASRYSLKKAQELFPEWYEERVVRGCAPGKWHIKRDLYDWFLRRIKDGGAVVGHRYFCIMCLAVYASKCDVSFEELESDALELQPILSALDADQPFTVDEMYRALGVYYQDYDRFPRATIERISAISMPPNKRNGRKQEVHLAGARAIQEVNNRFNGTDWRKGNGRPVGSGTKKQLVQDFAASHPEANHSEIARALGISRPTVVKWLRTASQEDTQR